MASLMETRLKAHKLLADTGLAAKGWRFEFDSAKQRGGVCKHRTKTISMSKYLVPVWTDAQVMNTLTHEAAHALAGPGEGHGAKWAALHKSLGGTAKRTHSNATVPGRWLAECPTHGDLGRLHRLSESRRLHSLCARGACRLPVKWTDTGLQRAAV